MSHVFLSFDRAALACALLLAGALLVLPLPEPVAGQSAPGGSSIVRGDEVRVAWWDPAYDYAFGGTRFATGEVMDFDGTHLMLKRGTQVFTVPMSSVRSVQRRIGTKPASAPAMVIGSASGFAAGFLAGVLTGGVEGGRAGVDRVDAGITTAVLIGAPMGALIAWVASRSHGIYENVPFGDLVSGLVVDADGRVGIRVRAPGR